MKYLLENDYEYDFTLYGICCHEKDYRLCWAINSNLNLSLSKTKETIDVVFSKKEKNIGVFSVFKHIEKNDLDGLFLVSNKSVYGSLIPEKNHFDYFLMIKTPFKENYKDIINKINAIPFVLTTQEIDVNMLKSKENLIF
ncbi:MAG: hypothetical protein CL846_08140 [Crocinitomicaceae bacterium]|nr:hypothetical protein [Crocinitomicaceae bacterium]|tara:strand:- start:14241 stop:14660 length:420 start_codon:yes stop_codon:yes gene_type:complete